MRLLRHRDTQVVEMLGDKVPEYAILSHTWGDDEVTLADMHTHQSSLTMSTDSPDEQRRKSTARSSVERKAGFKKTYQSSAVAQTLGFDYVWADTCCIDKTSSAELSEAINSMYRWYQASGICIAYLSDVVPIKEEDPAARDSSFRRSRWFTRGWTLQELIAPSKLLFFAKDWSVLGGKSDPSFCGLLSEVTAVDRRILNGTLSPQDMSVASRMKWAAFRKTTRVEDVAYSLIGIFNVNMNVSLVPIEPLLYGEGTRAFIRLQEEIMKDSDDQSLFAWAILEPEPENREPETLHGLLATSPALFLDSGAIRPLPPLQTVESVPSQITNQGLRVSLYLRP
ncbi:HET-domain-containing protein, partial [Thozetella sp. PMI_491]